MAPRADSVPREDARCGAEARPRKETAMKANHVCSCAILLFVASLSRAQTGPLPGTEPLAGEDDLAAAMVEGIDGYLMDLIEETREKRLADWESGRAAAETKRGRLAEILGVTDARAEPEMRISAAAEPGLEIPAGVVGRGRGYTILSVRWPVFRDVEGEGLLLRPNETPKACVVALPDCDWTPEALAGLTADLPAGARFAQRLAEAGCLVVVPALVDRGDDFSGIPSVRMTNQPHREFLWRAAYQMGRTTAGYEIQQTLAAVDWFRDRYPAAPVGVMGYGEGGLIAFYAAALDPRIGAACVSGYFQPLEDMWRQPIYRSAWSLLRDFGAAETAALIAPRALIAEAAPHPQIDGPPRIPGRSGAAPGRIETPPLEDIRKEAERARRLAPERDWLDLYGDNRGAPGASETIRAFLEALGIEETAEAGAVEALADISTGRMEERRRRRFRAILEDTQWLMRESEFERRDFWSRADRSDAESWERTSEWFRGYLWDEIIGRLPPAAVPANAKSRLIYDEPSYRGYEVTLDVYPGVFAYGILLMPKDIRPGERRPVVVCQHGLEGRPSDVADPDWDHPAYHRFACRLAEKGYITFSPQNPYIGEDRFRVLLRKGRPLKVTLYSFIVRQHERILEWLSGQPFADSERIAFYGLSYGGKTAMRIPPLLEGYCLSICSADYNEWIWKNVSARHSYSYLLTGEYDMPEFNLGNTFNYAELSWLIHPRPFMVERGHHDGVAPDEWVAYEFAKTRRHYVLTGLGGNAEIAFFNGPHTIHGEETFAFLGRHLGPVK